MRSDALFSFTITTNDWRPMSIPLAADYPFLDILWSTLIFMGFVMWIWLAISLFADIFRRQDIGGFSKAIWIILLIVLPFAGVLIYLIVNHKGIAERGAKQAAATQQAFESQVRQPTGGGAVAEIESASKLLASGTITQAEFDQIKARALSA